MFNMKETKMTTERKPQRAGANSVGRVAEAYANAVEAQSIPVPKGFNFGTPEEKDLWVTFSSARSPEDWLPHDLVMLAKVVELEVKIREFKANLEREGYIVENQRGTMVENAFFRVYQTALVMQLTIIRALSMNSTSSEKQTIRTQAKEDQKAVKNLEKKGPLSLIASRSN
jgi:hypothetical protein